MIFTGLFILFLAVIAYSINFLNRNYDDAGDRMIIKAFNREGQPSVISYIYASDAKGEPISLSFTQDQNGQLVCPLSDEPIFLNVFWEVEGFGRLLVTADNEGEGYRIEDSGSDLVVNLNYELAKSHLKKSRGSI